LFYSHKPRHQVGILSSRNWPVHQFCLNLHITQTTPDKTKRNKENKKKQQQRFEQNPKFLYVNSFYRHLRRWYLVIATHISGTLNFPDLLLNSIKFLCNSTCSLAVSSQVFLNLRHCYFVLEKWTDKEQPQSQARSPLPLLGERVWDLGWHKSCAKVEPKWQQTSKFAWLNY